MRVGYLRRGLIERRCTSRAQARLVASKACGGRADIGNFTGAETIEIRCDVGSLLWRTLVLGQGCPAGEQREEQAERAALNGTAVKGWKSQRPRLHGGVSGSGWRRRGAFANHRRYRKLVSPNVI